LQKGEGVTKTVGKSATKGQFYNNGKKLPEAKRLGKRAVQSTTNSSIPRENKKMKNRTERNKICPKEEE